MSVIPSSGIDFGFTASDLISNAGSLVSQMGPYVLLALAFPVAVWFISFLKGVIGKRKG